MIDARESRRMQASGTASVSASKSRAETRNARDRRRATRIRRAFGVIDRRSFNAQLRLFVCLLLNGTSALFRQLVPRIVEVEHMRQVKLID